MQVLVYLPVLTKACGPINLRLTGRALEFGFRNARDVTRVRLRGNVDPGGTCFVWVFFAAQAPGCRYSKD